MIEDKSKRGKIYPKVKELNRPTLKCSLEEIYDTYDISYSDLFPEFEFVGIRDKIVHGGHKDLLEVEFTKLIEDYEKLVALLQRTLLGMLDYNGGFKNILDNWKLKEFKKKID